MWVVFIMMIGTTKVGARSSKSDIVVRRKK